jgi:hypothetical protein
MTLPRMISDGSQHQLRRCEPERAISLSGGQSLQPLIPSRLREKSRPKWNSRSQKACKILRCCHKEVQKAQALFSTHLCLLCFFVAKNCPTLDLKLSCDGESRLETPGYL